MSAYCGNVEDLICLLYCCWSRNISQRRKAVSFSCCTVLTQSGSVAFVRTTTQSETGHVPSRASNTYDVHTKHPTFRSLHLTTLFLYLSPSSRTTCPPSVPSKRRNYRLLLTDTAENWSPEKPSVHRVAVQTQTVSPTASCRLQEVQTRLLSARRLTFVLSFEIVICLSLWQLFLHLRESNQEQINWVSAN
jgi:hypothetical protein